MCCPMAAANLISIIPNIRALTKSPAHNPIVIARIIMMLLRGLRQILRQAIFIITFMETIFLLELFSS